MQISKCKKQEITSKDLRDFLKNKRIKLDCGHYHSQHNFSSTLVVLVDGRTYCHNCYN